MRRKKAAMIPVCRIIAAFLLQGRKSIFSIQNYMKRAVQKRSPSWVSVFESKVKRQSAVNLIPL
jgi:hypothetical protein